MAPTADEELKLRLYSDDVSHLGPAERFLKVVVDIPFAFKRLESLLFVNTFQEEYSSMKESFETLEVCIKAYSLFTNSIPSITHNRKSRKRESDRRVFLYSVIT